ncbi:FxsA family protein [Nocardioides solisilvae]|uniref:FxsA family protein n=1 Tax=Nocardioides solisilvae TaxID=1542435 RepID=UPI000D745009|nr:FxsA family protein [Nocardioides solisilvae]
MRSGRRVPLWLPFVLLVALPLVELWALIQVGQVIGAWWTVVLLLVMGFAGGWLIRHEGLRAWRALAETLSQGRMPHRELADGALIVLAGALMLTPGFVTDAIGVLLILPGTRGIARRALTGALARKLLVPPHARRPGAGPEGPVVRGEVIDP